MVATTTAATTVVAARTTYCWQYHYPFFNFFGTHPFCFCIPWSSRLFSAFSVLRGLFALFIFFLGHCFVFVVVFRFVFLLFHFIFISFKVTSLCRRDNITTLWVETDKNHDTKNIISPKCLWGAKELETARGRELEVNFLPSTRSYECDFVECNMVISAVIIYFGVPFPHTYQYNYYSGEQ